MPGSSPPDTSDCRPGSGRGRRLAIFVPAVFFTILCVVVFYETAVTMANQGHASGTPISNAAFYPRMLALVLIALVGVQVLADIRSRGPAIRHQARSQGQHKVQIALVAAGLVAYTLLLPVLGFLLATPPFILVLLIVLGDRTIPALVGLPIGLTLGCLGVFQGLFNVNLPRGLFGIALNI